MDSKSQTGGIVAQWAMSFGAEGPLVQGGCGGPDIVIWTRIEHPVTPTHDTSPYKEASPHCFSRVECGMG